MALSNLFLINHMKSVLTAPRTTNCHSCAFLESNGYSQFQTGEIKPFGTKNKLLFIHLPFKFDIIGQLIHHRLITTLNCTSPCGSFFNLSISRCHCPPLLIISINLLAFAINRTFVNEKASYMSE